jgi:hypothetical protein
MNDVVWVILSATEWKPSRAINYVTRDIYEALNASYASWHETYLEYDIDGDGFEEFVELIHGDPETDHTVWIEDMHLMQKFEVL